MAAKNLALSYLLDIYGALLSDKQRDALDLYLNEDLSLGEIAENVGISRQGVRDQIKHAEAELARYETVLQLHKKREIITAAAQKLLKSAEIRGDTAAKVLSQEILQTISFD